MSKSSGTGKWIVIALLLAAVIGGWFTRQNYLSFTHSTRDAVLILPEQSVAESPAESKAPNDPRDTLVHLLLEDQLAEAKLSLAQNMSHLQETRQGVEDAVAMVKEQQTNFEFAQERYDRLMPLVETGALDPLAASQIQSAYISARASLAQAQFHLGQMQGARGEPEQRKKIYLQMTQRIEHLEKLLRQAGGTLPESQAAQPQESDKTAQTAPPPPPRLHIEALFHSATTDAFFKGAPARCSFSINGKKIRFEARVDAAGQLPDDLVLVTLSTPDDPDIFDVPPALRFVPCEVTIDTLPKEVPPEKKVPEDSP